MEQTSTAAPRARLASCIYEGTVSHHRLSPKRHAFRYGLFMMYLDLDELDRVFAGRWFWSAHRPAPARFRRRDYPGDPSEPLDLGIRALVERETGVRPCGPVRLLTNLRYLGYGFNPASFFFCFDAAGELVQAVVVHVTNTPWGETHSYVVTPPGDRRGDSASFVARRPKRLHVSPFLPMNLEHEFRFSTPGDRLDVAIDDHEDGRRVFHASLALRRREIDGFALASVLLRHPAMTMRIVAAIYSQALRLWRKRIPFHSHPGVRPDVHSGVPSDAWPTGRTPS